MSESDVSDEVLKFLDPLVLVANVAEESLDGLHDLSQRVQDITGTSFSRSREIDTAFYPKITLLTISDVLQEKLTNGYQNIFQNTEVTPGLIAKPIGWGLSKNGLLMLNIECPELLTFRDMVGNAFADYRPDDADNQTFGYRFYDSPLHLTMGVGVSESHILELDDLIRSHSGEIHLQPPMLYIADRSRDWGEDGNLNIVHRW